MTGKNCKNLIDEALYYAKIFKMYNIEVLDPVLRENIPYVDEPLAVQDKTVLLKYWEDDKKCLREGYVAINCDASQKSIGGEHEYGLMRFNYFKPVVLVYPDIKELPFISVYEDDVVCDNIYTACVIMNERWDTWFKRFTWRIKMLIHSLPKFIYRQWIFLWQ